MSPAEQAAFVNAYCTHMAYVPKADVEAFVKQWASGEDFDQSWNCISVLDALLVWNEALKFAINQGAQS